MGEILGEISVLPLPLSGPSLGREPLFLRLVIDHSIPLRQRLRRFLGGQGTYAREPGTRALTATAVACGP